MLLSGKSVIDGLQIFLFVEKNLGIWFTKILKKKVDRNISSCITEDFNGYDAAKNEIDSKKITIFKPISINFESPRHYSHKKRVVIFVPT